MYFIRLQGDGKIIGQIMGDRLEEDDIEVSYEEYCNAQKYRKFNPDTREFSEPIYDVTLDYSKGQKIEESKTLLAKWLEQHPLESEVHNSDKAFYNVTEEKQSLLNQAVMTAQLKINLGLDPEITWNSTTNVCEPWTMDELVQLVLQIEAYVKPRIKKQQQYEVAINECNNVEEVEQIEINYDNV